jgi:hypothetical protein
VIRAVAFSVREHTIRQESEMMAAGPPGSRRLPVRADQIES